VPVPKEPAAREDRRKQVRERLGSRDERVADKYQEKLTELYGAEKGSKVRYAEAFEVCEYGRRPSEGELKKLFGFSED
jgi:hypothetical protein